MNYKNILLVLVLCIPNLSHADLSWFEDEDIKTIYFVQKTHTKLMKDGEVYSIENPADKSIIGGEKTFQSRVWMDVENERFCIINSKDSNPAIEPLIIKWFTDKVLTSVIHSRKMVIIQEPEPRMVTSYFPLQGWFHDGVNLQKHIPTLRSYQFKPHDDDTRSFWLRAPKVNHPAEVFINEQNQVIKIHGYDNDPKPGEENTVQRVETYKWSRIPETRFDYPSVMKHKIVNANGMQHEEESQIIEIHINEPISDDQFVMDYPKNYQVQDMRSRKANNGTGGYGGFGGSVRNE